MYKKVFITGCAKSGTTLLWQLCYAFKDVYVYDEDSESSLEAFLRYSYKGSGSYVIAKRNARTIFSNEERGKFKSKQQYKLIKDNRILIINIVRDGRDVVVSGKRTSLSKDMYVNPMRWIASMKHRRKYKDIISCEIKYEDLVAEPEMVQNKISRDMGWEIKHSFLDFPNFVPNKAFKYSNNRTKPSIVRSLVGKNKEAYKKICGKYLYEFEKELKLSGYMN